METLTDLIAYAAELSLDKLGRSCGMRRVIETDMQALAYLPRMQKTEQTVTAKTAMLLQF